MTRDKLAPIYARITVNGHRIEHSIKRYVEVTRWRAAAGRAKGNGAEVRQLNTYLDTLTAKVLKLEREMVQDGQAITFENFREKWLGMTERPRMLMEIFQQHNDQVAALVGKEFSRATLERYNTARDHAKAFLQWKYGISDIDIKRLNYEFVCDFEFWLKSLCKEDVDIADKLVKALNPNLEVFFYKHRQEELISQSGPAVFARTFKEESRIVVILSRKKWSETYYTEIERNAIVDRTMKDGLRFLMVIPMQAGEIPAWYPETYIYASPLSFTIDQLARFIEFKVTEEGGIVKPLTLEDQYQNLLDRIKEKRNIINLQHTPAAIESAITELTRFKNYLNERSKFLEKSIFDRYSHSPFNYAIHKAYIGYGEYLLECGFQLPGIVYDGIVTTQDVLLTFDLYKTYGDSHTKKIT